MFPDLGFPDAAAGLGFDIAALKRIDLRTRFYDILLFRQDLVSRQPAGSSSRSDAHQARRQPAQRRRVDSDVGIEERQRAFPDARSLIGSGSLIGSISLRSNPECFFSQVMI